MLHISPWEVYIGNTRQQMREALKDGCIDLWDTVWRGPDGALAVAACGADLDEDCWDYTDNGTVEEYLLDE